MLSYGSVQLAKTFSVQQFVEPHEATAAQLSDVHTSEYLDRLNKSSSAIAEVSKLPYRAFCDCLAQHCRILTIPDAKVSYILSCMILAQQELPCCMGG